jgi:hypothetical protein
MGRFENCYSAKDNKKIGKDGKEGSARVSTYRVCHLIHSYTLEFGYHQNMVTESNPHPGYYTKETFKDLGKNLLVCIAELFKRTPLAKIAACDSKSLTGIREQIALEIKNKFKKKESHLTNKIQNINDLIEDTYYKYIK